MTGYDIFINNAEWFKYNLNMKNCFNIILQLFKSKTYFLLSLFFTITASGQVQDSVSYLQPNINQKHTTTTISTKDNYFFVYDGLYDMTGSAQNLMAVSHLLGRGLDELACKPEKKTGFNICCEKENFFCRMLIDFSFNLIFSNWLSTVQHECMGHGFRAREFDADINRYYISPGLLGGQAYVDFNKEDLPYYGFLLEETGGSESNTVLAREVFRQSLTNDYFYHYYFYSFINKIDLSMYILGGTPKVGTNEWNNPTEGRDVLNYIKAFNNKSAVREQEIYNSAKKGAYWGLADPSLLLSFYYYIRDYIIKGQAQVKNPMIRVKNISFLPFTDFHLSPFGFEYYLGTYLKNNKTLYETYYRWGKGNIDGNSYGFGLGILNAFKFWHFRFDIGGDFWKQDFNLLYYEIDNDKYQENILSGKIYMKTFYQINNSFSLFGQASYKGEGYLLGNPVNKGFNAKTGLRIHF